MGSRARAPLARLADALDAPVANQTALGALLRALSSLRNNASAAAMAADKLRQPLAALNLDAFMKVAPASRPCASNGSFSSLSKQES